uniref:Sulfatase N-terminal domain-containing protein n=1 Tax=Ditylum brightwellii TaxID=49249 RepID=A0A7S4VEZ2_9STRA
MHALDRLISENKTWSLVVSFQNPHPPNVAAGKYFDRYWDFKKDFFVPPSIDTAHLKNTPYKKDKNPKIQEIEAVKEWMVSYYALVEEVDHHIGRLLRKLDKAGQTNNTLLIFTSDHGESLGAHGRKGKGTFFEESVRSPLMFRLPNEIPQGKAIDIPTSSIDVFSTILDYTGNEMHDASDGKSLRRFIDESNTNSDYDNEVVVSEWDTRKPTKTGDLTGSILRGTYGFMVVKDNWKLIIVKSESNPAKDQLYNLAIDPFEMNNMLQHNGTSASKDIVGKVEHLKALLIEWMKRMNGSKGLYSKPVFNAGEGRGDIVEVVSRRTWKGFPIWVSDTELQIGKPALIGSKYIRKEFFYIGRTTEGILEVYNISVEGKDSHLIILNGFFAGPINAEEHERVKVAFKGRLDDLDILDAQIRVTHSEGEDIIIKLQGCNYSGKCHEEEK